MLALGTAAFAIVMGWSIWETGREAPAETLADYHAPAGSVAAIIPDTDAHAIEDALSLVKLDAPQLAELERELERGHVRLGVARVWDWADEDADEIIVSSAGFRQGITLTKAPTILVIPVGFDSALSVAPSRDGISGGVTVAFGSGGQEVRIRGLGADQSVTVALP